MKNKEILSKKMVFHVVFSLLIVGLSVFGYVKFNEQEKKQTKLEIEKQKLEKRILNIEKNVITNQEKNIELFTMLNESNSKNNLIENKIQNLSSVVGVLENMTTLDEELLKKYSKVYFLNEHYAPTDLSEIPKEYIFENKKIEIHSQVLSFMEKMLNEARQNNKNIFVASGFRSFGEQESLKNIYTVIYGAGSANKFSADQGYSEHQLGTTVDLTTKSLNGSLNGFEKTEEYKWLRDNAYKYGFVLSYPENNTYYRFEPWHWRFVGVKLATRLHEDKKYFYDEEQRIIDSYLGTIFEN